jgi:hypothetical protein
VSLKPEEHSCFHICHGCTKCNGYYGKYVKCVTCYPDGDFCDCQNGIIRWYNRKRRAVTYLRLGRSPFNRGTVTVAGQEAIKAEKEFQDYQREMEEHQRRKPRFYWNL